MKKKNLNKVNKQRRSWLKNLGDFLLNLFFPITCYGCENFGTYLCEECFKTIKFQEKKTKSFNLKRENLKEIFIAGDYDNKLLASLITAFKYEGIKNIGDDLGRFLNFFWDGKIKIIKLENKDLALRLERALIIPLPLTRARQKERGFNQSEILAKILAREFSYEIFLKLKRKGRKKHQASLSEKQRLKNIKGQFFLPEKERNFVLNRDIILIDDVITTGATLNEAARILKEASAKEVFALVLAKG
ncbi:ComF family protein [Patescibacteria group bacterium]|nr:ComF family protein [Patescibacteria group bacterium]